MDVLRAGNMQPEPLPTIQRENMNKLKSEINKAAHHLAQINQIQIMYALDGRCQALLREGKSLEDVARYLKQVVSDGLNGLDALMGHTGGTL